jgi:KTSC domain-containing protein
MTIPHTRSLTRRRSVTNSSLYRHRTPTRRTITRSDEALPTASNAISRLEYDRDTQTMIATFARDGTQIIIPGMSEIEAHRWANAESPGRYFNSFIRGKY